MNRDIKFKIWDKELKCFLDGDTHFCNEISFVIDEWTRSNWTPACFMVDESSSDRYVLLQYTGLKDKNGKEVYDGDIIINKPVELPKHLHIEGVVQWGLYQFWVEDLKMEEVICDLDECDHGLEVIGNIYENKDLLK